MGGYHKDQDCGYKEVSCYFWFSIFQHEKNNSQGTTGNITSLGTQVCPGVPLHAQHAGLVQLISFPLNASGCILLLSLHLKHLQIHEWFRKLPALRQVNPFHPDIRKQYGQISPNCLLRHAQEHISFIRKA